MPASTTRDDILDAAVQIVARQGLAAATVRAIAKEVGVSEAAVYRHYESKDDVLWSAYGRIIDDMAPAKERLVEADQPLRQRLTEWVRVSYQYYDDAPEAFTYVCLTPTVAPATERGAKERQGRIFLRLATQALERGEMRSMAPELALCCFTGLMLNVPRMINAKTLPGPAVRYTDDVADAAWRIFAPPHTD